MWHGFWDGLVRLERAFTERFWARVAIIALRHFDELKGVPRALWEVMVSFFPNVAIEIVIIGAPHKDGPLTKADLSVLLFPRLAGETHRGHMHLPGMRLRTGDSLEDAYSKIAAKYGLEYLTAPQHVENVNDRFGETGHTFHDAHLATGFQPENPRRHGHWCKVTQLPGNILAMHEVCIERVVVRFLADHNQ